MKRKWLKVTAVKTARLCVYTVSAGRRGDRRRQICHRILKFAFYKCIQKVTVLLLCSSLPHLNLIITALCKIWDSQRVVVRRTEVAVCLCSWATSSYNLSMAWRLYKIGTDHSGTCCTTLYRSIHLFIPFFCLIVAESRDIIYNSRKKWHNDILICISLFSKL